MTKAKPLRCRLGMHCAHMTKSEYFTHRCHNGFSTYQESELTYACCRPGCGFTWVVKDTRPDGAEMWMYTQHDGEDKPRASVMRGVAD